MQLLTYSPLIISNQVWSASTRTLSSLFFSGMNNVSAKNLSIAASASVDLRPSGVYILRVISIVWNAGAAGACALNIYDGLGTMLFQSAGAAGSSRQPSLFGSYTVGYNLANADAVNAATYGFTGWDLQ